MTGEPEAPVPAPAAGVSALRRYEMWIKTVMSPALVAALPVHADRTAVPRKSIHRLRVTGDRDVPSVIQRLAECGVEVVDLRVVGDRG